MADHSVLASLLSSLLLVGLVFMVYEQSERKHQEQLTVGLSGAGAGGLVDHLVDAEVALALVTLPEPPETVTSGWSGWAAPGKPLRWLRESREALDGGSSDPRVMTPSSTQTIAPERAELVDQGSGGSWPVCATGLPCWGLQAKAPLHSSSCLVSDPT